MTLEAASGTLLLIAAAGCIGTVIAALLKKHSQKYMITFASLLLASIDFVWGAGLLHIIKVEYEGLFGPGLDGLIIAVISFLYCDGLWTAVFRNEEVPGGKE